MQIALSVMAFLLIVNGIMMIVSEIKWNGVVRKIEQRRKEELDRKYKAAYPKEFIEIRREWEIYLSSYEQQKQ